MMTVALFKGVIASLSFLSPLHPSPKKKKPPFATRVYCLPPKTEGSISKKININASLAFTTKLILLLWPALWLHLLVKASLFYIRSGAFTCALEFVCVQR